MWPQQVWDQDQVSMYRPQTVMEGNTSGTKLQSIFLKEQVTFLYWTVVTDFDQLTVYSYSKNFVQYDTKGSVLFFTFLSWREVTKYWIIFNYHIDYSHKSGWKF